MKSKRRLFPGYNSYTQVFLQSSCCCLGKKVVLVHHIMDEGFQSQLTFWSKIWLTARTGRCPLRLQQSSLHSPRCSKSRNAYSNTGKVKTHTRPYKNGARTFSSDLWSPDTDFSRSTDELSRSKFRQPDDERKKFRSAALLKTEDSGAEKNLVERTSGRNAGLGAGCFSPSPFNLSCLPPFPEMSPRRWSYACEACYYFCFLKKAKWNSYSSKRMTANVSQRNSEGKKRSEKENNWGQTEKKVSASTNPTDRVLKRRPDTFFRIHVRYFLAPLRALPLASSIAIAREKSTTKSQAKGRRSWLLTKAFEPRSRRA